MQGQKKPVWSLKTGNILFVNAGYGYMKIDSIFYLLFNVYFYTLAKI